MPETTITRAALGHTCIHQTEPGAPLCGKEAVQDVNEGVIVRPYCEEHKQPVEYELTDPKTGVTSMHREIRTKEDVDDTLLDVVEMIVDGWYDEGPIDWENVWDRVEASPTWDWTHPDMGSDLDSPAMRYIKREIRKRRREG